MRFWTGRFPAGSHDYLPLCRLKPTFTIHGEAVDLNTYINTERTNRFMAAKIKKQEMERICWQLEHVKVERKIDLTFQAFVKDRRKDPDNIYVMFVKFFLDALKEKGIIENDGQKQIGDILLLAPQIGEPRIEIALTYSEE